MSPVALLWPRQYLARLLILGVAYYGAAWLSLRAALVGQIVTPIWPPTGIAVVALLVYGIDVWPAIAIGALAINLPISSTGAAFLIATGNTLAPLIAVGLLRTAKFRAGLDRTRDALSLVVLGALVAMTVSASFGTAALLISGAIAHKDIASTWSVWWAGDATGVLVFAPLLLSLGRLPGTSWRRATEAILLLIAVNGVAYFVFHTHSQSVYLVFPLLIWAAMRFGQLGASTAALSVVAMAVWAAVDRTGPFAHSTLFHRMLALQTYDAVAALTSLILAAVAAERARALDSVQAGLRRERGITETLQRSLLPERLPEIPGVALASRYRPGAAGLDVGGDWYDVFVLPDGQLAITIGDVVGRGLIAAATMGQLRTAVRAYALETHSPASVVERLSTLARELEAAQMTTLIYAVLDPATGTLTWENAGHPPPLLLTPDGGASFLDDGRSPPLGVTSAAPRSSAVTMQPGSTLVLYTDGLVEPRLGSIEEGMEGLRIAASGFTGDLDALCDDRVLRDPRPESSQDDVAVLAVRLLTLPVDRFELLLAAEPEAVRPSRRAVEQWLARSGADADEIHDLVLACNEATTNVLEHAYGPAGGTLEIEGTNTAGEVCIVVRDRGKWRAPRDDGRGRGLLLMQSLVDDVDVVVSDEGSEVRLHRRLGGSDVMKGAPAAPSRTSPTSPPLVPIIRLRGAIDILNAGTLYDELLGAITQDALGLVVDLSDVEHLDSAGIRLIYRVASRLGPRRQDLRVVAPVRSPVRRVLALSHIDSCAPVTTTVEEAVADIRVAHDGRSSFR